jgi:hypothetical protein
LRLLIRFSSSARSCRVASSEVSFISTDKTQKILRPDKVEKAQPFVLAPFGLSL